METKTLILSLCEARGGPHFLTENDLLTISKALGYTPETQSYVEASDAELARYTANAYWSHK